MGADAGDAGAGRLAPTLRAKARPPRRREAESDCPVESPTGAPSRRCPWTFRARSGTRAPRFGPRFAFISRAYGLTPFLLRGSMSLHAESVISLGTSVGHAGGVEVDFDGSLVVQIVLFLTLMIVLRPILFDPMLKLFEEREK